jgi:putative flavoprotein involved in K+ transport
VHADGTRVTFGGDLATTVAAADRRLTSLLGDIDAHIDAQGLAAEVLAPEPVPPVPLAGEVHALDLKARGIASIIWATGYRRAYPWLHLPVLDERGEIRQRRGVTPVPGLYVLGQRFQHFRSSNFIHGVGRDAAFVAAHVAHRLATKARP